MSSPEAVTKPRIRVHLGKVKAGFVAVIALAILAVPITVHANLPAWLQHIVGASTVESALYRVMPLPGIQALYPRPPREAQTELTHLIASTPDQAELYQLRARADEQSLDESAAEADWKLYTAHAKDPVAARLELADFYQRRLLIPQEIAVLNQVAAAPPLPSETFLDPTQQRSWRAYNRLLLLLRDQGLPASQTAAIFTAFLTRYPDEPALYAAFLNFQLDQRDDAAAQAVILRFQHQFPQEPTFPIRARALIESRRGNTEAALAIYDRAFQPLWSPELVHAYFALLEETHRQRAFVAQARAQLAAHPDGPEALNALARIFYYDQQAGRLEAAQRTLDSFRIARESRGTVWTPLDLYTLATLTSATHAYAESARYNFALALSQGALPDGEPAAQSGLSGLITILLEASSAAADSTASENTAAAPGTAAQPLALGAQNLTLYRDIATLDQGPGYWNGILSLWLNGTSPQSEYIAENAKAQSYFHRLKAAELLAELDRRFPAAAERPSLHAALISALADYGEPAAVVSAGRDFLAAFATAPERLDVASLMADAYARQNDTAAEFSLYDAQLAELSAHTGGLPLTAAAPAVAAPTETEADVTLRDSTGTYAAGITTKYSPLTAAPTRRSLPEATAYARILDRYLARLTATGQLPRALSVLRAQLDRNPNDPLLYERLATFLEQNNLSGQQEQVFEQAFAKFQQPTWYDKLARLYLREQKRQAFAKLTRQVTGIFSGTELDQFFASVNPGKPVGPQLALQLNQYAAKRFPHDLVFTRNLLSAYQTTATRDNAAYEALLRAQWWESPELQTEFLTWLSRTGKLQPELDALNALPASPPSDVNPAALDELAELHLFTSHFEQAAPLLGSLAALYPANPDTGDQAVSLFRSLAYLDPTNASTQRAVALETNLLTAEPDSPDRLATLGDLYAEATSTGGEDLASAAPYWRRMPALHPGSTAGYLTSATIFWDYFQFDAALAQIAAARTRFQSPALFAYEAGAIDENRHLLPEAIAEYISADLHPIDIALKVDSIQGVAAAWFKPPSDAADSTLWSSAQSFVGQPEANARLLALATRPATRLLVDAASLKAFNDAPANPAALTLRADVLTAQHHAPELNPLLTALFDQALTHAATLDEATAVGNLAQARGLTPVYERALGRQAALTPDPVQKIELEYTLARSLEANNDIASAGRIVASVYQANPRLLGVVRATTDFYARPVFNGKALPQRAIATLLEAARSATPELARDFTLEAANRANDANDTVQARALALSLLQQTPYDARVLNLVATSYARAHDDAGLKQFYVAQLEAARTDPGLSADARRQDTALLRRGLIPALTRLNDFQGATTQYIALLSAFPEDSATAQEAALYTLKHSRQPQLLDFLRTTVQQSPRDSRFAILLAQVETTFEDLTAAESAYSLAIAIRKDRVDLYTARADIETRLSQSDPAQSELAAADFSRLYLLTYHDPSWMVRLAELRARQQRPAEAVKALVTAYIIGHPADSRDSFTVAAQLAQWNLLDQARTFAEQGRTLAGANFLNPPAASTYPEPPSSAAIYARILTRLGQAPQALTTLVAARKAAEVSASSPSVLAAELARENISDEEAADFRRNFAEQRRTTASTNVGAALDAIGSTVKTFYTPEEKLAYAQALDQLHTTDARLALMAAASAGLTDREAAWRRQILLTGSLQSAAQQVQPFTVLEHSRLQFAELAQTLEAYAARQAPEPQTETLRQAAQAFRDAGDLTNETRLDRSLVLKQDPALRDRYFDLLLRQSRAALTDLAGNPEPALADAALNYTVAHAGQSQALAAVALRGKTLAGVWSPASASLVLTYFAGPGTAPSSGSVPGSAPVDVFEQSLAYDASIATRLTSPAQPAKQLTGDLFFYYASRFGIFLATAPKAATLPDAEDFLPAELEQSPASPAPYLNLARTYVEAGQVPAAVAEFTHALELKPSDPAIEDEFATVLFRAHRSSEALTHWHAALAELLHMQQHAIYPEAFFTNFETVTRHLGERHLTAQFRPELEAILGPYLAHNGNYRSNELLQAIYAASATPEEGTASVLALAANASTPESVLSDLHSASWLSPASEQAILLRRLDLAIRAASPSDTDNYAVALLQRQLVAIYLANHEDARAQALIDALPTRLQAEPEFAEARIVLAAHAGRLEPLLTSFRATPEAAPSDAILTSAANTLAGPPKPDEIGAHLLREFVFDHKQLDHTLDPTDFLALAQSRVDTGDLPGALTLLRRLTLYNPKDTPAASSQSASLASAALTDANPYANTDSAASLLEAAHHPAEAIPFLESLVETTPWNASYRLRLAQSQRAANAQDKAASNFLLVARDPSAPYELRIQAARELNGSDHPDLGSRELALIAHPSTPAASRQPYFAAARIASAAAPPLSSFERDTLLREAVAIAPEGIDAGHAELTLLLAQPAAANPSATLALLRTLEAIPSPSSQSAAGNGPDSTDSGETSASPGAATSDASSDDAASTDTAGPDAAAPTRVSGNISPTDLDLPPIALPSAASALIPAQQIQLAAQLSSVSQADGDLEAAFQYAQLAVTLGGDAPQAALIHRRDELKAAILLERRNALRRPTLHKELAQSTQVRPRLSASDLAREETP